MHKRNITLLAALAIIAALFATSFTLNRAPRPSTTGTVSQSAAAPTTTAPATPAKQVVAPDSVTIPVTHEETVLEAMRAYASSSSFTFTGTEYPSMGIFVDSINGRASEDGYGWFLYVNGTSAEVGASSARVAPGDVVQWRYEQNHQ